MGLTSAMYTGLTGLSAHQMQIETIGHNIANVNTTAYKSSRTLFQTQFSEVLTQGTAPSDTSGGTNPLEIGRGVLVGSTQRTTTGGSIETTGMASDLAIEGAGYFIVQSSAGREQYTRDGSFTLNSRNELVTTDGYYVRGFGVDSNYEIVAGTLQNLVVPLGQASIARATANAVLDGELSAAERLAISGSVHSSQSLVSSGAVAAEAATALTDLRSAGAPDVPLFADGDVITLSGASRGGRAQPSAQFTVGTTGSTLGEFAAWLQDVLGIQAGAGLAGDPGVVIEDGALVIRGNVGEPNAIAIQASDITSTNASTALPFQFTQEAAAEGGGVVTGLTAYDSLGNPVTINATFVLVETPNTGPVWRYFLEVPPAGNAPRSLATGTVTFDTAGNYVSADGNQIAINRDGTGASPLTVTLDFQNVNGLSTRASEVVLASQDGYPAGTLIGFGVDDDGTINGVFSNGTTRKLGQVALATFANEAGLVANADNLYSVGPNSGTPVVTAPGSAGAGLIRGGALELSNVDLSREFIGLITSSTGFQANSRVISTSNEMLDQLLLALR